MNQNQWLALALSAALATTLVTGCQTSDGSQDTTAETTAVSTSAESVAAVSADVDLTDATEITMDGTTASITGSGAEQADGVVTVSAGGTYVISGTLTEGRILVDAKGESVTLVLNGADITCSYGSPIYIVKAEQATIYLSEGTSNSLTDGAEYTFEDAASSKNDDEPNACLYSKASLTIQGSGALAVHGLYANGILCKDSLSLLSAEITVDAVNHGITGKDGCAIEGATLQVVCGGDGIRSTNDSEDGMGTITVADAVLTLDTGGDGISAATTAVLSSGTYTITTGGGSALTPAEDTSAKGIKAVGGLTIDGGTYTMDCSDDAFHTNGDLTFNDGTVTLSTGDDGFHADETLNLAGGTIQILTSYEGLEGKVVNLSGGEIHLVSTDDGVNAADGSSDGGMMGGFFGSSDCAINITGGYLYAQADGDGLDSNGSITMTDGTVIVSSSGADDAPLDYDSSFTLSGGTILAIDNGQMTEAPSQVSQPTISVRFDTTVTAGSYVALTDGDQQIVFALPINTTAFVYTSPDLVSGDTYTLSYGGTYDGETTDLLGQGGTYTDGTQLTTLTLADDSVTQYGSFGMGGGQMGGMDGQMGGMGGQMGDGQNFGDGTTPQMPTDGTGDGQTFGDGTVPEMPTDANGDGQTFGDGTAPQMPTDGNGDGQSFGDGTAPQMPTDGTGDGQSFGDGTTPQMPTDGNGDGQAPGDGTMPEMPTDGNGDGQAPGDGQQPADGGADGQGAQA